MTTVVNTPSTAPAQNSGNNGFLIGILLLIAFVSALIYFGIPVLKGMNPVQVNVESPQINMPAPQVNIPTPQINVPTPEPTPAPEAN